MLSASLEILDRGTPHESSTDTPLSLRVRATNDGDAVWLASTPGGVGTVRLAAQLHVDDVLVERDYYRAHLSHDASRPRRSRRGRPCDSSTQTVGRCVLRLDMVDEGIAWFGERQSSTLDLVVGDLQAPGSPAGRTTQ